MAKGKKNGKSSSKKKVVSKYPPPVILKTWPGKLTDQEIEERHQRLLEESRDNYYSFVRVTQVDWKFHDFYIMIDQKTPIFALQHIISQIQHQGAILPTDVLVYKSLSYKSTSNIYKPYDFLQFTLDVTKFSRGNSPWPIGQPIFLNNQYSPNNVNYMHINYDIIPYMNTSVQKSLTDNIWDAGIFKNSIVMSLKDDSKKLPQILDKSQYFNASLDIRRVSMIKTKK